VPPSIGESGESLHAATSLAQIWAMQSLVVHCGFALTQSMRAAYRLMAVLLAWTAQAVTQASSSQLLVARQSANQLQL
jgi:hypothetical protein